jgi:cytochrome b
MTIGAALFTIAVGAVLAFAVTAEVAGIDLEIVGYILLAIVALGLVFGLWTIRSRGHAAEPPPRY